ncbi:integrase arm-type DNA-binding domain-containing protein [Pusillimonas sp. SM2304]|uniref:tyrosine-type recombinase/integrase n=1 Tax=Pusillimonas sp. SM2304 TaxID=3073241 RepID=UPI002875AC43|nr:integrase arm-type DNA-binding domain-containing protein [Pusillimonas sp. SM2304]MDS1141696.1 integrase arm-type DNA-binding domain-containing protein [Pusillimonas sp. SM2304]
MARIITPLTDIQCRQAKYSADGKKKLFDGGGLYLLLKASGTKTWRLKYVQPNGKENTLTFGDYPTISLQAARDKRSVAQAQIAEGKNPAIERELAKQIAIQEQNDTFKVVAEEWLAMKKDQWSEGYHSRISNALKSNAYPDIGNLPVAQIPGLVILGIVQKVEKRGALEMASRVLDSIGMVFKYAAATGRVKANPADGLDQFLKDRPPVKHRPHVDAPQVPELLRRIDNYHGRPETIYATKLMVRTFPRTSELIWVEWPELDLDGAMWVIPPDRMKGRLMAKMYGPVHLIPLSTQVVTMLRDLKSINGRYKYVFPGERNPATRPISNETINKALKTMGYEGEQTGHGFRGLASTIMNDSGLFRPEAIEMQLSHKKKDQVEAAYNHAEYFLERVKLMQWWSDYLEQQRQKADSP